QGAASDVRVASRRGCRASAAPPGRPGAQASPDTRPDTGSRICTAPKGHAASAAPCRESPRAKQGLGPSQAPRPAHAPPAAPQPETTKTPEPPRPAKKTAKKVAKKATKAVTARIEPPEPVHPPLWPSLRTTPGYALELLAIAAVDGLAPHVREQLAWLR